MQAAHGAGLWIRFYTLNGHDPKDESGGWSAGYNFGSEAAARERWQAAIRAGVDFIAVDRARALRRDASRSSNETMSRARQICGLTAKPGRPESDNQGWMSASVHEAVTAGRLQIREGGGSDRPVRPALLRRRGVRRILGAAGVVPVSNPGGVSDLARPLPLLLGLSSQRWAARSSSAENGRFSTRSERRIVRQWGLVLSRSGRNGFHSTAIRPSISVSSKAIQRPLTAFQCR